MHVKPNYMNNFTSSSIAKYRGIMKEQVKYMRISEIKYDKLGSQII